MELETLETGLGEELDLFDAFEGDTNPSGGEGESGQTGPQANERGDTNPDGDQGTEDGAKDGPQSGDGQDTQGGEAKAPESYKLRYNGQEVEKSLDELKELAQKGMNYDHVKNKLDEAKNAMPALELLEKMAAASGMDLQEYMEQAQQQVLDRSVQELTAKGLPQAEARELLQLRAMQQQAQAENGRRQAQQRDQELWLAFVEEFPKVAEGGKLEPEVVQRIQAGETPVAAQRAVELKRLQSELDALKADRNNRQTAPPSAAGLPSEGKEDTFLSGLERD